MVIVLSAWSPMSRAGDQGAGETPAAGIHPGPGEYLTDVFLPHMWQGAKASFTEEDSILAFGLGTALTVMAYTQDEKMDDYWDTEDPLGDTSFIGDVWGAGYIQAATCLGMYGWAHYTDNQELATTAEVLTEATLIQTIVINSMKPLFSRKRPEWESWNSFPSGHTGAAFVMAAVLDHRLGHKWGVPLYALALFTGLSRMEDRAHYASDVVMGATIATVVGYQTSRYHDDYPYEKTWHRKKLEKISIMPCFPENGEGYGIMISMPLD